MTEAPPQPASLPVPAQNIPQNPPPAPLAAIPPAPPPLPAAASEAEAASEPKVGARSPKPEAEAGRAKLPGTDGVPALGDTSRPLPGAVLAGPGDPGGILTTNPPPSGGSADIEQKVPSTPPAAIPKAKMKQRKAKLVSGKASVADVEKVLKRRSRAVKACYQNALKQDASLAGKLTVRFTVDNTGKVASAEPQKNETGDAAGRCVIAVFQRLRFPPAESSSAVFDKQYQFMPGK
jgi:hypothetical protein